jgi:hypothetical protein
MSTQANFDVRIFDVEPGIEEDAWERVSAALVVAIKEALAAEDIGSVSVVIRGPEILSLFN